MNTEKLAALVFAVFLTAGAAAQTTTNRQTTNLNAVLINTDPVPVESGEDAEINFKIRNTGNSPAENVEVQIVDSFPFQLKPDRQRSYSLGEVVPGQEYQISTEVLVADDSPDGQNSLKVRITQGDFSRTAKIPVQVQSQDIELNLANLKTTPTTLTPDTENAKLTVETVNNGEKTAENAVITLGLPDSLEETSSFSTRQALGNIGPGEVKSAEFTFDISQTAEKGSLNIPANLSYTTGDSSTQITEETGFSFYLSGKPQFEVVDVESSLKTGKTGELRVTAKNTGSEEATASRIRVLDSSDLPFSYGSSSKYIGTLEPGQNGTAVFDVSTESSADAKEYLLDFEIRGVQDTQVFVEDTTLKVDVKQGQEDSGLPVPLPVIAAVVVLAAAAYIFRDRFTGADEPEEE